MPTLRGTFSLWDETPVGNCRWCGYPTTTTLAPPAAASEPIPMHAICGAEVIDAYNRLQAGQLWDDPPMLDRLKRLSDGR